ncbi:MAG: fibrillarin-like rRNA/tRNA 2'-O-methyltransferase [Methanobacteriota archaeon]|nr:MAG: fibrillarin-like rRNA/tRNA 2'-O-methyltransferase [Euryarchaeota archaeon]
MEVKPTNTPGIYRVVEKPGVHHFATENLVPRQSVYGEKLLTYGGKEYRIWDPNRSKLAAALKKGLDRVPIEVCSRVLYLGAASGTTASHISDICREGRVYCVEFSPRVARNLVSLCETRVNMVPLIFDASNPVDYAPLVERVDTIYQDVAQPNQTEILLRNAELYLEKGGHVLYFVKSRSIDVTRQPEKVFREEKRRIEGVLDVLDVIRLDPYEKDHILILARKGGKS